LPSRPTIVKGDAATAMAAAPIVVRERYVADMAHPVPIEPHSVTADWSGDRVTIWSSTQVPFYARTKTAEVLGIPEHRVRVVVSHLGGGFGGKCDFHFEAHVAALARACRRPVRLVLTRREEFIAPDKVTHAMIVDVAAGVAEDGTIVARTARIVLDSGAYASDTRVLGQSAAMMVVGPYRIPDVEIEALTVYTNRTPSGSVRAPTGPQSCWAVEQHHDVVAARVALDPVEFRRRNLVRDGDEGPTRQKHEGDGAIQTLELAVERARAGGPLGPNEAIGVASGWWFSAPGPSGAVVRLLADGAVGVKGSPDRRVTIAELASTAHEGALLLARGSGQPPASPEHDASACVGRLGFESFASPTFFCHAARVSIDPATGVARAT